MSQTVAVVLNWRTPDDTARCARSLMALNMDLSVVVVDNASGDGSLERLTSALRLPASENGYEFHQSADHERIHAYALQTRRLYVLNSGKNGGYAFGNNYGARVALADPLCEFVWILNSDTIVPDRRTLTALLGKMQDAPDIGICGSTVVYMEDVNLVQTHGGGNFNSFWGRCAQLGQGALVTHPVDEQAIEAKLAYVNGACAFVRRAFIEQVGLMNEGYFLYYEEIDWAFAGRADFRVGYCADAIVHHSVGGAIGTRDAGERSMLSTYYLTRSRLRFLYRYSRRSLPFALLDLGREVAQHIKRRRWLAAKTTLQAICRAGKRYKQV